MILKVETNFAICVSMYTCTAIVTYHSRILVQFQQLASAVAICLLELICVYIIKYDSRDRPERQWHPQFMHL